MKLNGPRLVAVAAMAVLLVGCAQTTSTDVPEPITSEAEPSPSQSGEPKAEVEPASCQAETQEAIENTIKSQTSAFAEDNFELAYSFSSPTFRSGVSLESFVQIIEGSYGPLIESSKLKFSNCLISSEESVALIDVSFLQSGDYVYALRYLMSETRDGWKVEGAGNLEVVGEGS